MDISQKTRRPEYENNTVTLEGKTMDANSSTKLESLREIVASLGSALVAYSGGVDSTFLLKVAKEVLGEEVMAVTATSVIYPFFETDDAMRMAKELSVRHLIVPNDALSSPSFTENAPDRCYWCKKELFSGLTSLAKEHHLNYVMDGTNTDDVHDFRPGMRATKELQIRSPLQEAGLTKDEIRSLSRTLGLPTWDKPTYACYASRFPYGTRITEDTLFMVAQGENFLRNLGLNQLRVRHHDSIARIELMKSNIPDLLDDAIRQKTLSYFKELGYAYVALDLEGYRTGSMNEVLATGTNQDFPCT